MESPKNHIELVTEIIPPGRSRCFAKCEMQNVSGVYRAEPDILFNFRRPQICLFCMRISDVIRPSVCNPRYSGEYIINYISLLIISILPSIWSYILKECQVLVEEKEAEAQS